MPVLTRLCEDCEFQFTVLEHGGEVVSLDHEDDDHLDCPKCGSENWKRVITAGTGVELGDEAGYGKHYPRYDRGLGCWVRSKQHRAQICKERNLTPVDGDWDFERAGQRLRDREDRARERWKETEKLYKEHEDFRESYDLFQDGMKNKQKQLRELNRKRRELQAEKRARWNHKRRQREKHYGR